MSIGIRKTFNLDMVPGGAPPIIHLSAEDVGRPYRANLLYDGEGYDLEDVTSVVIRGTKPDNTVFEYDLTFDTEDSHVDFNIKEQMAIIAGQVLCEIRLFSGEDTIGSANFILDVETAVYDPEAASESYIPTYETAIQEALENVADDIADLATAAAINDVKQYSDAASESATAAAESAAEAFSGTPDGYSTLVSTVNSLNSNLASAPVSSDLLPNTLPKGFSIVSFDPSTTNIPVSGYGTCVYYANTNGNNKWYTAIAYTTSNKQYKASKTNNANWSAWQLLLTRDEFNALNSNTSATSVFMAFPREALANNTDLNNVLIGDWYCGSNATKNSLSNLPSGVGGVFRLQVISLTRDGVTAPTNAASWIRRVQTITDYNGKIYIRIGSKEGASSSLEWGAWKSLSFT